MSRPIATRSGAAALSGLLALLGCAAPPAPPRTGQAGMDAQILATCRQRANEIYDRQNRAAIYAPQYGGNTPLSGGYVGSPLTAGLSEQFAHERMIRDCVRTATVTAAPADAPVAPDGAAPATSPPATGPGPRP